MQFDAYSNLWVLPYGGEAVLALGPNGDLLGTVSSPVPSLYYVSNLQFDRSSNSLVFGNFYSNDAVSRISADDGSLIQDYTLPDRLRDCHSDATQVTGDGNLWLLLECFGMDGSRSLVHVINRAGKVQREFPTPSRWFAFDMVVDAMDDRVFIGYEEPVYPYARQYIEAYTLDGTPLFNLSLNSIRPPLNDISRIALAYGQLHVIESVQHRLTVWSSTNGSLLATFPLGDDMLGGLVADRDSAFVSRYSVAWDQRGPIFNSSIVRLDRQGNLLEQYGVGSQQAEGVFFAVALSDDGSRLYAIDEYYGALCVWRVNRREAGEEAPKAGEVPFITPMQVIKGMQGEEGKKAGGAFAAVKGQPLPASMFVLPEEQQ